MKKDIGEQLACKKRIIRKKNHMIRLERRNTISKKGNRTPYMTNIKKKLDAKGLEHIGRD